MSNCKRRIGRLGLWCKFFFFIFFFFQTIKSRLTLS